MDPSEKHFSVAYSEYQSSYNQLSSSTLLDTIKSSKQTNYATEVEIQLAHPHKSFSMIVDGTLFQGLTKILISPAKTSSGKLLKLPILSSINT